MTNRIARIAVASVIVAGVAAIAGCRTAPMIQADALAYARAGTETDPAAAMRVRAAIITGARRAGWTAVRSQPDPQREPTTLYLRFHDKPDVFATVRLEYANGRIAIAYVDSSRFGCEPRPDDCTTIDKRYNEHLLSLRSRIEQALSEPTTGPIGVSRAVSIVRQFVEEQPRHSAYIRVDVTDERISAIREVVVPVHYTDPWTYNWPFYGYSSYRPLYGFYPYFDVIRTAYVPSAEADVVYFNNIGRIELRAKRGKQAIEIWDRYGEPRMRLSSPDESLAKRFVDAIGALEQARLAIDAELEGPGELGSELN